MMEGQNGSLEVHDAVSLLQLGASHEQFEESLLMSVKRGAKRRKGD